ncbi:MAG: Phosphatidylserine decarboxylase proenzyme [candidate division WS2 bacterium]|uniref:Phosphatidylserine decarboxylase proenzyme n=1 Tax=Psychracetigena formicireducens TaxID=2986056 RepID=A0A9E2BI35_PSYF1|nr:Phosphatidylserine decarboxylase proenzyme [Candidatus Psychracetigena formicireducens]MBT9145282.1 Phosphatidylserine decarboxylase proenzyme [Candidatus Psychracetigena formicireducens]
MWYILFFLLIIIGLYIFLRFVWFFRDPIRVPALDKDLILSPADGKVIYIYPIKGRSIKSIKNGEEISIAELSGNSELPEEGWAIGIYMSPLDVHFNYSPIEGKVVFWQRITTHLNLPMVDLWEYINLTYLRKGVNLFGKKFHLQNERASLVIENQRLKVGVVEIADKFVNKITPLIKEGDLVKKGQKIGFISRGSQVDLLIFRTDIEILVKKGQQVYGVLTPLVKLNPNFPIFNRSLGDKGFKII